MHTTTHGSSIDVSAITNLYDSLKPDTVTALDPSNTAHNAAIQAAFAAAGRSPDRYPHLHSKAKERGQDADNLTLIDKGADKSGRATAMTWMKSEPHTAYSGGALFALDGDSGDLLALGHNSNVHDGFVPVSTDTASAKKAGKSLKLLALNHSVSHAGDARFTALASYAELDASGATITVTEPTLTPKYPPEIRIALGRTATSQDVDYWYAEPQNITNPYLIVPFMGNAMLPYEINGTIGQPISGAAYVTQIYFVNNAGTVIIPMNTTYTQNFTQNVTVGPSSQSQLTWSYPYGAGGSYTSTTSLVYNPESLVNEQVSYFFYSFQIPVLNAPTPTFSFAVCSNNTPNEPSYQCEKIDNLWFWWHCLPAGTQVTLADGSQKAIEDVDNSHRVQTGEAGTDLAVEATTRGEHKVSADGPDAHAVYRLTTDAGHELVATKNHVIGTPDGLAALGTLGKGDQVLTGKGSATVTACERIDFEGSMYNLKLGDQSDRDGGLPVDSACTFVANGIVVGDHFAQRNDARNKVRDIEHMKSRLAEHLVADYASAISDIRY